MGQQICNCSPFKEQIEKANPQPLILSKTKTRTLIPSVITLPKLQESLNGHNHNNSNPSNGFNLSAILSARLSHANSYAESEFDGSKSNAMKMAMEIERFPSKISRIERMELTICGIARIYQRKFN